MWGKIKIKKWGKTIFPKSFLAILLLLTLFFSPIQTPRANAWDAIPAALFKQLLENIQTQINGMILGMLKKQALANLNTQINSLVGGGVNGSPAFITNWQDYLFNDPANQTRAYMNDYLSRMTSGRGTYSGYISEGFSGAGANNYLAELKQIGINSIKNNDSLDNVPKATYEGDPDQMFASGNFRNMSLYLSGTNNPWAFDVATQNAYQTKLDQAKEIQKNKSLAYQGFKGTGEKGFNSTITNPGSLIKEAVANVQNLGNNIIANANNPGEIIGAVVSQMITQSIQQGFSAVQRKAMQQNYSVQNKINDEINNTINTSGPGARFNLPNAKF